MTVCGLALQRTKSTDLPPSPSPRSPPSAASSRYPRYRRRAASRRWPCTFAGAGAWGLPFQAPAPSSPAHPPTPPLPPSCFLFPSFWLFPPRPCCHNGAYRCRPPSLMSALALRRLPAAPRLPRLPSLPPPAWRRRVRSLGGPALPSPSPFAGPNPSLGCRRSVGRCRSRSAGGACRAGGESTPLPPRLARGLVVTAFVLVGGGGRRGGGQWRQPDGPTGSSSGRQPILADHRPSVGLARDAHVSTARDEAPLVVAPTVGCCFSPPPPPPPPFPTCRLPSVPAPSPLNRRSLILIPSPTWAAGQSALSLPPLPAPIAPPPRALRLTTG